MRGGIVIWLVLLSGIASATASGGATSKPVNELHNLLTEALAPSVTDPREAVGKVAQAAMLRDPSSGSAFIRRAAEATQARRLPSVRHAGSPYREMADAVAPVEAALRDDLLRLAVGAARAALAEESLWQPRELPPGAIPYISPEREVADARYMLHMNATVWEVVASPAAPDERVRNAAAVLADARAHGHTGGCTPTPFEYLAWNELARFDPALLLEAVERFPPPSTQAALHASLPEACFLFAYYRDLDVRDDAFTKVLITFAVRHDYRRPHAALRIYKQYDLADAWERAKQLEPDDWGDRLGAMANVMVDLAWHDLDDALAAAEAEPDSLARRELLTTVASVWACVRPETIDRAIRAQDTPLRHQWAREAAEAELRHRRAGGAPHNARDKLPHDRRLLPGLRDPTRAEERSQRIAKLMAEAREAVERQQQSR